MIKIATPVSHLFNNEEHEKIILQNSDVLECRDRSINYNKFKAKQIIYHCDFQPIHKWNNVQWEFLRKIKINKPNLKLLTFHLASCCDKPSILNGKFEMGGRIYSSEEMKTFAKHNFIEIRKLFGPNIELGIENNNFYAKDVYRDVTEPEFISAIVKDNNLNFLFDIAHAKITCFNKKINYEDYKRKLPLEKIIQIHFSGYGIEHNKNEAFDAHNVPNQEDFLEIKNVISQFSTIRYLTVEYYKDIENLETTLKRVKNLL